MAEEKKSGNVPTHWQMQVWGLRRKKKWDEAIALLSTVIPTLQPDGAKASAYEMRGKVFDQKGEHNLAIADYSEAIGLNPDEAAFYCTRGIAYRQKGDHGLAIADYDQAIKLKPDYSTAYNNRGVAYRQKGDTERALSDYNKAIEYDGNNHAAYNNRGATYKEQGKYELALSDLDKAISIDRDYPRPYVHRGTVHKEMGNPDLAAKDLEEAIKISLTQNTEVNKELIETMREITELYGAMAKDWSREIEEATGYKEREKEHADAHNSAKKRVGDLLGYLFALYVVALFALFLFKHNAQNFWEVLPWMTALLLATSPIIWLARIFNREQTRHLALREKAYANRLMNRLLFQQPRGAHMEELVKKFFDHHDLRGSAQLIMGADKEQKIDEPLAEIVAARVVNILRRDGDK